MFKHKWNTSLLKPPCLVFKAHFYAHMLIYIYKAEILSICLFVRLSVTLLIRLGLSTLPYQLCNIKNPSSSSFKFITASKCGDQLAFYSRLKTKKWRKLEQHSIENHSHMAQSVVQLTCIQEARVRIQVVKSLFFFEYQYFCKHVF